MNNFVMILIGLAILGVFISLVIGVLSMGSSNKESTQRSQKMMRIRVAFQLLTIVLLLLFSYLRA